jgi:VWFA-related protein
MASPPAIFLLLSLLQSPQEVIIRTHTYTPPTTLRAETNLVEVPLTVRDWAQGHAVPGLHASDFEVLDNGVPQKITAFSELRTNGQSIAPPSAPAIETTPPANVPPLRPRFVTFFFDDFHGGAGLFVTKAAHAFIAKGLKPGDHLSIVTASGQGDLDFTEDAKLFADRIDHLASHERAEVTAPCGLNATDSYIFLQKLDGATIERAIDAAMACAQCGADRMPGQRSAAPSVSCRSAALGVAESAASTTWEQTQAQTLNTISALGFAAKKLSEVNGTRILVMNSSGFLIRPDEPDMEHFIDGCVRWNIVVHAVGSRGLGPAPGLLRESLFWMPLEKVTAGTGGHFFKNTNDLAGAMDLAANPEVTYLLAFNPGTRDGKFHTLKIKLKSHRSDDIQFRPGYFSPADPTNALSKQTLQDIPATVSVSSRNAVVSITIKLDVSHLQFAIDKGRHDQQIVFLMTLLDQNGAFVTGKESIMDLSLTDERLASFQKDGLKTMATLNAPSGVYQVRTIVREAMKGNLAASTTPINLGAR